MSSWEPFLHLEFLCFLIKKSQKAVASRKSKTQGPQRGRQHFVPAAFGEEARVWGAGHYQCGRRRNRGEPLENVLVCPRRFLFPLTEKRGCGEAGQKTVFPAPIKIIKKKQHRYVGRSKRNIQKKKCSSEPTPQHASMHSCGQGFNNFLCVFPTLPRGSHMASLIHTISGS
jgi:hypothetical protein